MSLNELTGEKVGVCVSGGLSSLTVVAALADAGVRATAFIADIGQARAADVRALAASLEAAGIPGEVVDLRESMARQALDLVRYEARYEGGYWNTTGAARLVLVAGLSQVMRRAGCTVLAHGCVGGGNDQRRFARYTASLAPDMRVFAPWTDPDLLSQFPDRAAMAKYVLSRDLALDERCTADYSVDGNLAGFAHEGTALERLETPDSAAWPALTTRPERAPSEVESVTVTFDRGRPVAVGGRPGSARELVERANAVAGRHGVGLRSVVENRINGTKCRGVYEAPGLDLLGFCADRVYQVAMDTETLRLMRSLSGLIGVGVYEGRYFDTPVLAARAAADVLVDRASATVEVELYKGNVSFRGMTHLADVPMPPRQTRFTGGGHAWQVTGLSA